MNRILIACLLLVTVAPTPNIEATKGKPKGKPNQSRKESQRRAKGKPNGLFFKDALFPFPRARQV